MNILVTILARANSKGFPGKNLKLFYGKPLYRHTVDQALAWGKGDVVVSTDSKEIIRTTPIEIKIINRPAVLAEDHTPKLKAIRHALNYIETIRDKKYNVVIDLDITNPLRLPDDIENAFQLFIEKKPPVLFSVTEARRNPYFNQVELNKDGTISTLKNLNSIYCRQDAPRVYDLNCSIYIYDRNWLINSEHNSPIVEDVCLYYMKDWQAFDVDNEVDWEILKTMYYKYMG